MKRYTLTFQPTDSAISTDELKNEVERVLLRLHPRITYKLGQVMHELDGKLLAQIAVDGKRELLDEALKGNSWKLPVRFESLSWGWLVENDYATSPATVTSSTEVDPLAGVKPIEGVGEFLISKWYQSGRYIALMASSLVLILIMIANAYRPHSLWLQGIYIVWFGIFMFLLSDTPLDFGAYAKKIGIRQQKLEVSYWMLKAPVSLGWDEIWGLDYINPVCIVYSRAGRKRFLLSERFGCKEKPEIMKTIVNRANLRYVEGNILKLIYRKPDAEVSY